MSYSDNKIDILNLNIVFAHSIMTLQLKNDEENNILQTKTGIFK
jgi:hypothetical protein